MREKQKIERVEELGNESNVLPGLLKPLCGSLVNTLRTVYSHGRIDF